MYTIRAKLVRKRVVDFLFMLIELFSLALTAEALRVKIDRKLALYKGVGQYSPIFHIEGDVPIIFAWIDRPINALEHCRGNV